MHDKTVTVRAKMITISLEPVLNCCQVKTDDIMLLITKPIGKTTHGHSKAMNVCIESHISLPAPSVDFNWW